MKLIITENFKRLKSATRDVNNLCLLHDDVHYPLKFSDGATSSGYPCLKHKTGTPSVSDASSILGFYNATSNICVRIGTYTVPTRTTISAGLYATTPTKDDYQVINTYTGTTYFSITNPTNQNNHNIITFTNPNASAISINMFHLSLDYIRCASAVDVTGGSAKTALLAIVDFEETITLNQGESITIVIDNGETAEVV